MNCSEPTPTSSPIEAKFCPGCRQVYPVTEFHHRNHGDGYQSKCKKCQIELVQAYQSSDQRKEYMKNYQQTEEYKELARARQRAYYERNKERIRKTNRRSMQKAYQDPVKRAKKQAANREYQRRKREHVDQPAG